jgi:aminoglycoside phosphotransferase (APT) family kinase protein
LAHGTRIAQAPVCHHAVVTMPLPLLPGELAPSALTELMLARAPGTSVRAVEIIEVHEVTNTHVRIRIECEPAHALPEHLFVKMVPRTPERRAQIARTDMGRREVRFYDDLAPHLALRVPRVYATAYDESDGSFLIVMEHLVASGCTISDGTVGVSCDAAARALEELADLHVRYEDPGRRAREASWVPRAVHGSPYGVNLLREGLANHRERMSDDFAEIARLYVDRCHELQALWREGPVTVVHGDPHIGNLFDDHGRVGFLDWGTVNLSTPMRDVSYFLTMAMDVDDRRAHERTLLAHYLDARVALGGASFRFGVTADPYPYPQ